MGAALGAAYGVGLRDVFPGLHIVPAAFALAGMAGIVAGATGAALTAIVMIFEMTLDYSVVLPMTLTVAVSYGLRRYLCRESIYTMKLARRGHYMPQALQANALLVHHVSDMTLEPATVMAADSPVERLDMNEEPGPPFCVVLLEGDTVTGILPRDWVLGHPTKIRAAKKLGDVALRTYVTISSDATIVDLMALLATSRATLAVVLSPSGSEAARTSKVLGVVTKGGLAEAFTEGMELFAD
jgi:CIC family chloride channel protein